VAGIPSSLPKAKGPHLTCVKSCLYRFLTQLSTNGLLRRKQQHLTFDAKPTPGVTAIDGAVVSIRI
jgi:hypothetical protein